MKMENCGSMMKSTLVVFFLVAVVQYGSAAEKLASCCKKVTSTEITDPILGYMVQLPNPPCVRAVIFQTEKGLFCSQLNARWVRPKIQAFREAAARSTTVSPIPLSPVSLLSIITSTASTSSSSSSSFPSTSKTPAGETISETATSGIFSTSSR